MFVEGGAGRAASPLPPSALEIRHECHRHFDRDCGRDHFRDRVHHWAGRLDGRRWLVGHGLGRLGMSALFTCSACGHPCAGHPDVPCWTCQDDAARLTLLAAGDDDTDLGGWL